MSLQKTHIKLKIRRTKIVATVGPASNTPEVLQQLIDSGVNVFRLNMSHGSHEEHRQVYNTIRELAQKVGKPIGILADLCGPKIRVGKFAKGGIELITGHKVVVTTRDVMGEEGLIPTIYKSLSSDVKPGDRIFLNDGLFELQVIRVEGSEVECEVVRGGYLTDRKGINLPGVSVSAPALTEKDRRDVEFCLELGVDLVALSFVRRADEVLELRSIIEKVPDPPYIVSKIEKPEALENIDAILEASDAIMVARGDLGVELPPEEVPVVQDQLLNRARAFHRPVIVATQMLESMIDNQRPTRAEVSDVSRAVVGGADAVMLSAETAAGQFPVEAVRVMDSVAREMENHLWQSGAHRQLSQNGVVFDPDSKAKPLSQAFGTAVADLSRDLRVRAVVAVSRGRGHSASHLSSARPAAPILAISAIPRVCNWMNLMWGVSPCEVNSKELEHSQDAARRLVLESGLAAADSYILKVGGFSSDQADSVPTISVLRT